jgi:hypothetical protein
MSFDFDEIVPLVGSKFLNITPNNQDKDLMLIKEDNNIHDSNAVAVYSKRNNKLTKLGFIIKDKNVEIRNMMDSIKTTKLIRSDSKSNGRYYYYVAINLHK